MDSVGIGEEPDAAEWGDAGTNTIVHTAERCGGLNMPTMQKMGYGNLDNIPGIAPTDHPTSFFTISLVASNAKDTLIGHWEIMGLNVDQPFKTFTDTGFPDDLIEELETKTGHKVIGNYAASGTEIIKELGEEHLRTGDMIVYTSGDSVLQIAAHEEAFGLDELYRCCEIAREITMKPEWKVGRIIARPFLGDSAETFYRTSNRHDYSVDPAGKTVLDTLKEAGIRVISIGKISDIFNGNGITEGNHIEDNHDGMMTTIRYSEDPEFTEGLCFVNLVDFDAKYGHRRNPEGYGKCLEEFDVDLDAYLKTMREDDLVILTADHGNDPTHTGTDHTREMVHQIYYSPSMEGAGELPLALTFANIGATVADNFEVEMPEHGVSVLEDLK